MRRGDAAFKYIKNKFCCSAHFLPSDFKQSLTGHRRDLKREAIPSVFEYAPVTSDRRGERLELRSKTIAESQQQSQHEQDEQPLATSFCKDIIVFGPQLSQGALRDWDRVTLNLYRDSPWLLLSLLLYSLLGYSKNKKLIVFQ